MPPDRPHGELVLGPDLGVVERIEVELGVLAVAHDLHLHLPLGEVAALDGVVQVFGGVVEVGGLDRVGFLLRQVLHAELGDPVILDEHALRRPG